MMHAAGINHFELLLLLLLTLVAGFAVLAKRIQVPYPIVLVIGGLVLSFIPHVQLPALNPDVVFFIFLPPLLFSASFRLSWRDFRNNLVSIVMLAFGLVGFTIWGVGLWTRHMLPGFDWKLGLVLGSVIATTDAIAATATAKRLGLPRNIVDLLEAESLVNDGSGLLALKFTAAMVVSGFTPTFAGGVLQLAYLIAMAVAIGLAAGFLGRIVLRRISDAPVETAISLMAPYITYLAAEAAHCSGVLATIACGLYLGHHSSSFLSLHARLEALAFWRTADFILNGLVFLLLGLQLSSILNDIHGFSAGQLGLYGAGFAFLVIALRLIWIYPGAWLSVRINRLLRRPRPVPDRREVFLVGWAGMRGVLALAAALSLPRVISNGGAFPQRSLVIYLAFCAIFATLVLQGLSMPWLIRKMGLAGSSLEDPEENWARAEMLRSALHHLQAVRRLRPELTDAANALQGYYARELRLLEHPSAVEVPVSRTDAEARRKLASELRAVERATAYRMRSEELIHDEVLRRLERELDLLDARFETAGDGE